MRNPSVGGLIRLGFIVSAIIIIVWSLTGCNPNGGTSAKSSSSPAAVPLPPRGNKPTPQGTQNVSPGKDPNPQAYAAMPITATCGWTGRRWVTMLVTVNAKPLGGHPRELRYDDGGDTNRSQTFEAHPGDAVTLDCAPMVDQSTEGIMICTLKWFNNILQPGGFQRKQAGSARCYAQLPMRA